jgi:hypothetical protein
MVGKHRLKGLHCRCIEDYFDLIWHNHENGNIKDVNELVEPLIRKQKRAFYLWMMAEKHNKVADAIPRINDIVLKLI